MPWAPAEFLTFRLLATARPTALQVRAEAAAGADASAALKPTRTCHWRGEAHETPVYDGTLLRAGNVVGGPAIVEERTTTIVIPGGFDCAVDERRNFVLRRVGVVDGVAGAATARTEASWQR